MSDEIVSLRTAASVAGVSYETVRKWCAKYQFGHREGGRWRIPKDKLLRVASAHVKARAMLADLKSS
jgi:predicted site-specific integrase-resolvase